MVLTLQEESLISVVRALPPEEAGKVLNWARQLADLAAGAPSSGPIPGVTRILPKRPRLLCSASRMRSGETVEARRRRRGRVSRRAGNQDSSRRGALDGRLPST